ncbi:hypothetical protein [Brevundimonas sp.]
MLIALLGAVLIGGQASPDRSCLDDNHRDICAPAMRADLLSRLGMTSVEDEAAAGVESYRAFFVDGYGRDLPAMAFERRPGQGPVSVVYGFDGAQLETPISAETWGRVLAESHFADRELVDNTPAQDPSQMPLRMCLHAWVSTVEMSNSQTDRWSTTPVRRRVENTCDGALTTRFAFFIASESLKAQPHCQALDQQQQRNAVTTLATCLGLGGDRISASAVMEQVRGGAPRFGLDQTDPGVWRAYLGTNGSPRLTWGDQTVVTTRGTDNNVAEFIVARLAESRRLTFEPRKFAGVSAREATVEGIATRAVGEGDPLTVTRANYRQTWVWDPNLAGWMVSEWTVGPFAPVD